MSLICCYDAQGNARFVPSDSVIFSPAVYGIFITNEQVLLMRHPQTQLLHPPGDILNANETPTQTLRYAFRLVTGMTLTVGPLLFVEDQYRIDDDEQAWHLSVLYYALNRPTLAPTTLADLTRSAQAQWISLADLNRDQTLFGYEAIQASRLHHKL